MAKRMQEEKREERIVAKSKPTLNLASHAETSCSIVQSPFASRSPEILRAPCQTDWTSTVGLLLREHTIKTQLRVLKCGKKMRFCARSTRRPVAAEKNQELLSFHVNLKGTRKLVASRNSDSEGTD